MANPLYCSTYLSNTRPAKLEMNMALIIGDQPEYNKSLTVAFFQTARPKHGIDMIISIKSDGLSNESEKTYY